MKRLWELLKSVLIAVLICTLLLLTLASFPTHTLREIPWLSSLLQPIAPLLGLPQAELAYVAAAPTIYDAAQPVAISVRNSAGRSTALWDFAALDDRFDTLGGFLGQALDTAGTFVKVPQSQVETALAGSGVYFSYGVPLPVELTASWLGAGSEADLPDGSGFLLACEDGAVTLYVIGASCCCAATPLDAAELEALLEAYRPDESQFAFEAGLDLAPLDLIPGGLAAVPGGRVTSPVNSRFVEQLATGLGFNPYGESRYTDTEGATHFTEANCSLQVDPSGRIVLLSTAEERFRAAGEDLASLVEMARQLTDTATGGDLGSGRLYLSGVRRSETETVCTFGYRFSGLPVVLEAGPAATVTFSGSAVTQMTVLPRVFTATDETIYPLPVPQAAALVDPGASLELQYRVTAEGTLDAGWKK